MPTNDIIFPSHFSPDRQVSINTLKMWKKRFTKLREKFSKGITNVDYISRIYKAVPDAHITRISYLSYAISSGILRAYPRTSAKGLKWGRGERYPSGYKSHLLFVVTSRKRSMFNLIRKKISRDNTFPLVDKWTVFYTWPWNFFRTRRRRKKSRANRVTLVKCQEIVSLPNCRDLLQPFGAYW